MEIDKELYKQIKEYCDLNGLKTKDYIYNLLKNAFMADKYGDKPFMQEIVVKKSEETVKAEENFQEIVDSVGGPDAYSNAVNELIYGNDEKEETQIEQKPLYTVEDVVKTNDKNVKKSIKRKIEAK